MEKNLKNKSVAILATDGFEESELMEPMDALKKAGSEVKVISLKPGKIKGWKDKNWSKEISVDDVIDSVSAEEYDALVLPGGVINSDQLRMNKKAVNFVNAFFERGKPIAAICHGPWTLIETGKLKERTMTSYPSLKTDLINAGVNWVDEEVVVDNGLVTSRRPADLHAFCEKMVEEIKEGIHA